MSTKEAGLRLLTLNVNGLGSPAKVAALMRFLETTGGKPHVVCLQEVKLADAGELESLLSSATGVAMPFRGKVYYNAGSDHARGVAILVCDTRLFSGLPDAPSATDAEGRVIRVDCTCMHHPVSILSVYAHTEQARRVPFFQSLHSYIPAGRTALMGGDWNCIVEHLDQSSQGTSRLTGSSSLTQLMSDMSLIDAFRDRQPSARAYTHVCTSQQSAARLDRWLISRACASWLQSVQHVAGSPGDHDGVILHLAVPSLPNFGPGKWGFPVHILHDPEWLPRLEAAVAGWCASQLLLLEPAPRWRALKTFILRAGTAMAQQRRQLIMRGLAAAQHRVHAATTAIAAAQHTSAEMLHELAAARAALSEAVGDSAARSSEAVAAVWRAHGERCSATHFAVGSTVSSEGPVHALTNPVTGSVLNLCDVSGGEELSEVARAHYASSSPCGLYRPGDTDSLAQDALLDTLQRRLDTQQAQACAGPRGDGSITVACLEAALREVSNGTAPGRDGLPFEVYKRLWHRLADPLCAALNDVMVRGAAAAGDEWAEGVIVPVYKGKGLPRDSLASYRPITLLNCDYKLCARIISDRLQEPLEYLVDSNQSAFLQTRWIGTNVLLQQLWPEYLADSQLPGVVLLLDVEKAYDKVDRGWIYRCAESMGLPPSITVWLHRLTDGTQARVCVNGWVSDAFAVETGVPQGSPLSPLLWVMQLQPLASALQAAQREGRISAPLLPGGEQGPIITTHADDSKLWLQGLHADGPPAWEVVQSYSVASGARMQAAKAQGACLGSHPSVTGVDPVTQVDFGQPDSPPIVTLGLPLAAPWPAEQQQVYGKRLTHLRLVARKWAAVALTAMGRSLNAKQLLANTLSYHATFVPPDAATTDALTQTIVQYVVRSHRPEDATVRAGTRPALKPSAPIACLPPLLGGLGLPDLHSFITALAAKVIAMAFAPGLQAWKVLLRHALAAACPYPAWGPAWVLSSLPLRVCVTNLSPRVAALVEAFKATRLGQLPLDGQQQHSRSTPVRALLLEPLYCSQRIMDPTTRQPFQPPTPAPAGWPFTLGQLARSAPSVALHPQLRSIAAALPQPLADAFAAAQAGEDALAATDTHWCCSSSGQVWVWSAEQGGVGEATEARVRECLQSGLLVPASAPPPTPLVWQPACVVWMPKPRARWSEDELQAYDSSMAEGGPVVVPQEECLLGPWSLVAAYPPAWGHGPSAPLHHYTSSHVRSQLTLDMAASSMHLTHTDYVRGAAVRPLLWRSPSQPQVTGLAQVERRWTQRFAGLGHYVPEPVSWMQAAPPRATQTALRASGNQAVPAAAQQTALAQAATAATPAVATAGAATGAGAAPAQQQQCMEFAACWKAVWQASVPNHIKVFAYRLLHAALPVNAMRACRYSLLRRDARCLQCPSAPRATRPLETYSHLFVQCHTYRPAVDWLVCLWEAVSGHRPPLDAAVLVADDPAAAWQHRPQGAKHQLWTALRLTLLYHVWAASRSQHTEQRSAAAVVRAAIASVSREITHQFTLQQLQQSCAAVPQRLLRRLDPGGGKTHFASVWAESGLVRVSGQTTHLRLEVLLSDSFPVAAPAMAAASVDA
jgi:exonuclease III